MKSSLLNYPESHLMWHNLLARRYALGIRKDLSVEDHWFGRPLRLRGLFIWGRLNSELSRAIQKMTLEVIIHNETRLAKAPPPKGYRLFKLRDLQEFPYLAWVKFPDELRFPFN